ncbi:MAG: thioredoxin domain-containing protein, partial [Candidatus Krumholzibacteriia bacterium]
QSYRRWAARLLVCVLATGGCGQADEGAATKDEAAAEPGSRARETAVGDAGSGGGGAAPEADAAAETGAGTRHEAATGHPERRPNRLIHEKSPYLLQHAHNPVDWYPWGDEAFAKAREEDRPIFLSIGYSTCHWCHVMERESFENEAIARFLNDNFVSIKVDREERPDIDRVYMSFVQATTGRGGWPMSVWLTPDRKPFFGGTYFPPERRGNRAGFLELLHMVRDRWGSNRLELVEHARRIVEELQTRSRLQAASAGGELELVTAFFDKAYDVQKGRFDARHGGFGGAPKFPRPYELLFLHRVHERTGDPKALEMSRQTLLAMADGGIHDHLGGGFHRYSTDAYWRLPHFEKMLYDQAQLVMAYLEAYQLSGEERFAEVTRDILDYVRRDLTGDRGGFLSAEDADSGVDAQHPQEKEEGAFYVWRRAALDSILAPGLADLVVRHYGVRPEGNVSSHELAGQNVLYIAEPLGETAATLGIPEQEARERLREAHARMLEVRAKRPRPHLDDKVLTAWNGLMISAFARAAAILGAERDLESATRAVEFVLSTLWDPERNQLLRRYRDGEADIPAFNVDYAYLVQGLLDLYEASFELRWLEWARKLTDRQIELFADPDAGGFFEVTGEDPTVFMRNKEDYDGAQPTSNSVTVLNLLRLGEMTDSATYRAQARQALQLYASALQSVGPALPAMMVALDFHLSSPRQIIIAGRPNAPDTGELLKTVHERFLPHRILLLADGGEAQKRLATSLPFLETLRMESGRATAYVCQNYACQLPVTTAADLAKQLDGTR